LTRLTLGLITAILAVLFIGPIGIFVAVAVAAAVAVRRSN